MNFNIQVNDQKWQLMAQNLKQGMSQGPLLRIAGQVMRSSIERTFREQGSPAGSWKPLAESTLRRDKKGKGGGTRKILIRSGKMKNSVTYEVDGNELHIGTNLVYARIQQEGGYAGRREPKSRQTVRRETMLRYRLAKGKRAAVQGPLNQFGYFRFRRPFIPARPYLVFRPEDPQKIAAAMERYISTMAEGGPVANPTQNS